MHEGQCAISEYLSEAVRQSLVHYILRIKQAMSTLTYKSVCINVYRKTFASSMACSLQSVMFCCSSDWIPLARVKFTKRIGTIISARHRSCGGAECVRLPARNGTVLTRTLLNRRHGRAETGSIARPASFSPVMVPLFI